MKRFLVISFLAMLLSGMLSEAETSNVGKMKKLFNSDTTIYDFLKARAEQQHISSAEELVVWLIEKHKKEVEWKAAEKEKTKEYREKWREEEEKLKVVPLLEGLDSEAPKQKLREFFEALIIKDFEKANTIHPAHHGRYGLRYSSRLEEDKDYSNVVKILSIGEPYQKAALNGHRKYAGGKGVFVPFEIELANGKVKKGFMATRSDNPEGEWHFDGGALAGIYFRPPTEVQKDSQNNQLLKPNAVRELLNSHTELYDFLKVQAQKESISVEALVIRLIQTYKSRVDVDAAEREQLELQGEIVPPPEDVDSEKLKQVAWDFLEALVDKDFERARAVAHAKYEWLEQDDRYSNVVRVITVGEPFRRKGRYADGKGVHIPFEIELTNGRIRRAFINIRWDKGYIDMRGKELGIDIPEGEGVFDGGL